MAPRKRNEANAWLRDYPGLHIFPDGRFYVIHPTTKAKASLKTRDAEVAKQLYVRLQAKWAPTATDALATALMARFESIERPKSKGDDISFRDYAKRWREDVLGVQIDAAGKATTVQTKVMKRDGKPIEARTQRDYGQQCRQLEQSDGSLFALSDSQLLRRTRQLLAPWAHKATHYNHLLAVASHIYKHAIVEGIAGIDRNPTKDIEPLAKSKREVYIPDADYVAVTTALIQHVHNNKEYDGSWRARICDLLFMLSSRPVDVFKIRDSKDCLRLDLGECGEIHFGHGKNKVSQIIVMNEDMREVVDWFIAFKRRFRIISPALLCFPPYMGNQAGAPVTHRTMQKYWAEAVVDAGFTKGAYRLQDLRKKGLTDEFVTQGENDKGGHKTAAMANYYRLIKPPKRAKNTLVDLRKAGGEK